MPADKIDPNIAGLIILAAAPYTAMVFVWSNLIKGEPHFTLSQVALNDAIMVVAFAPIVGLLLGLSAITVPWGTLTLSVALYIVVLVIATQLIRKSIPASGGEPALQRLLATLSPASGTAWPVHALIGASNFFELAVAAAISLFGFNPGAALATVVGVLIEVPVMLSVVGIVNRSKGWYERGSRVPADV